LKALTCGTFAEFFILNVKTDSICLIPDGVSFEDASCVALAGVVAYSALSEYGNLKKDQSVLVIGASGGVGSMVTAIAKSIGAKNIVAICSAKNHSFVKSMGATHVVDYCIYNLIVIASDARRPLRELSLQYDLIIDCVGGPDYYEMCYKLLNKTGLYIGVASQEICDPYKDKPVDAWKAFSFITTSVLGAVVTGGYYKTVTTLYETHLPDLAKLLKEGAFSNLVKQKIKAKDAQKAKISIISKRTVGKIVLTF
jgi:NADPH:quinone reductase-like Zn-dependent oxidoreductase